MDKPVFVISCPIDTYSGYGARSRDIVKAIIKTDKYDVKILPQRWGNTSWGFIDTHPEWEFLKEFILSNPQLPKQPEIWMQITVPNEQGVLKPALKAYNDKGNPTGIGGDDKCGVYACLELLKELPNLKVAFFVSEETGCHGSRNADPNFFDNVGYAIQFDAPGNHMVTEYSMGVRMFDDKGEFKEMCNEVLTETFDGRHQFQSHPYTDVYALKESFDFSCINFSIGYYRYHTPNEYVVVEDVYSGIETGKKMIEKLGYSKYKFKEKSKYYL